MGGEWSGRRDSNPRHPAWKASALPTELLPLNPLPDARIGMVEGGGFEPPQASPTDLQSVPFDLSGTPPHEYASGLVSRQDTGKIVTGPEAVKARRGRGYWMRGLPDRSPIEKAARREAGL